MLGRSAVAADRPRVMPAGSGRAGGRRGARTWIGVLAMVGGLFFGLPACGVFGGSAEDGPADFRDVGAGIGVASDAPDSIHAVVDTRHDTPFTELVTAAGEMVELTPGGPLARPVTVRFPLSTPTADRSEVLIATSATGAEGTWELLPASEVSADGSYAFLIMDHFSFAQAMVRAVGAATGAITQVMRDTFEGLTGDATAEADPPSCQSEQQARGLGFQVESQGQGDALAWCFGLEQNVPTLKVVNQRRYPLLFDTAGFRATGQQGTEIWNQAATLAAGENKISLFPRLEYSFAVDLDPGAVVVLRAELDGLAQSFYQLEIGAQAVVNAATKFGKLKAIEGTSAITLADDALHWTSCVTAVRATLTNPNAGSFFASCFSPEWISKHLGKTASALLLPAMVNLPVLEFFRSEANALGDQLNGRDRYAIGIRYSPVSHPPAAAHTINRELYADSVWRITLTTIESDGAGTLRATVRYDKLRESSRYLQCPGSFTPSRGYLTLPDGHRLELTADYCGEHLGERQCTSYPCTQQSWGTFTLPSDRPALPFDFHWYGWGSGVRNITLAAPPPG